MNYLITAIYRSNDKPRDDIRTRDDLIPGFWTAVTSDYDGDGPMGVGMTEAEAIGNLLEQLEQ